MQNQKSDISNEMLLWAKETLNQEAEAIAEASKRLSDSFAEAATVILETRGKVVLTGLGKSGHIARKISSTFASTGTPSFYLHPTEALHGDFGMISPSDCLIAIAFGGQTDEIIEVAKFARRLGTKIISITGNLTSTLAQISHIVIDGSVQKEACPLNLAPTSSSTLALALGDALAICLMKARGFGQQDFAALHPRGSLGRRLVRVRDLMRPANVLPIVNTEADFKEILEKVTNPNFGILAVLSQNGKLEACITDGDLRRALMKFGKDTVDKKAAEIMVKNPKIIEASQFAVDALRVMEELKITALFVVDNKQNLKLEGLIRMHDLIEAKII